MNYKSQSTRQNKYFYNLLQRFVFSKSEVIMGSKLLYSELQKYVPLERVHYCLNGIPDFGKNLDPATPKIPYSGFLLKCFKILLPQFTFSKYMSS